MSSPFSWGTRVLAAGAALFALFLGVGWALPGTWSAERTLTIAASPESVFPYVDSPSGWKEWTPWPEQGITIEGPERGAGGRMAWKSPDLGEGAFEIVESLPFTKVAYRVEVEGGSLMTAGSITLDEATGGTRVTWREEGDFGWNPLMGYWALGMARVQGRELEKGLERLRSLAEDTGGNENAPSGSGPESASPQGR